MVWWDLINPLHENHSSAKASLPDRGGVPGEVVVQYLKKAEHCPGSRVHRQRKRLFLNQIADTWFV